MEKQRGPYSLHAMYFVSSLCRSPKTAQLVLFSPLQISTVLKVWFLLSLARTGCVRAEKGVEKSRKGNQRCVESL